MDGKAWCPNCEVWVEAERGKCPWCGGYVQCGRSYFGTRPGLRFSFVPVYVALATASVLVLFALLGLAGG